MTQSIIESQVYKNGGIIQNDGKYDKQKKWIKKSVNKNIVEVILLKF